MTQIEVRDLELELNSTDDHELKMHGYISTNAPSAVLQRNGKTWREVIPKGVFARAIDRAMRQKGIDLLFNHDKKLILSSTSNGSLEVEEDDIGLYFSAKVSKTSWGKDLYELVKDRIIKGLSFGMVVNNDNWTMGRDGVALRTILDIDLFEISAVQRPAYPESLLELRDIEIVEVDVPDNLEERDTTGDEIVNENEITILLNRIYDGMTLIAQKIDDLDQRFVKQEENQLTEELQEAKALLTESKALAKAQAELVNANVNASQEEKDESNRVIQTTSAATPNTEKPKPIKDSAENKAEKRSEDLGEEEEVEELEKEVSEETQKEVQEPEEEMEEKSEVNEALGNATEAQEKAEKAFENANEALKQDPKDLEKEKLDDGNSEKELTPDQKVTQYLENRDDEADEEEVRSLLDDVKEFIKNVGVMEID